MPDEDITKAVEGKVVYLLALVSIMQTIYPITAGNNRVALIAYQLLIASLVVVGILLARDTTFHRWSLILLGATWAAAGAVYAFNLDALWALLLGYGVLIVFQSTVIQVMLRFIFQAQTVTRDVLYAAVAVYILIGAVFVSAYGLLETSVFAQTGTHSFIDAQVAEDEIMPWQNFVYYSYTVLTTLGFGDILPVTPWARSLTSVEAVIGVLYLTIIMARLVGLFAASSTDRSPPS